MKMVQYNEVTDLEDLETVSPAPHPTAEESEAQRVVENLQEGLLTLREWVFHLSALLLSARLRDQMCSGFHWSLHKIKLILRWKMKLRINWEMSLFQSIADDDLFC